MFAISVLLGDAAVGDAKTLESLQGGTDKINSFDPGHSLNGWQNLTWGMSKREASKAMPQLKTYHDTSLSTLGLDASDGERFGIRDLQVGDCHFSVKLVFGAANGQLDGVIMQPILENGTNFVPPACRDDALSLLRKSYGIENKEQVPPRSGIYHWNIGRSAVDFVEINTSGALQPNFSTGSTVFIIIYHFDPQNGL